MRKFLFLQFFILLITYFPSFAQIKNIPLNDRINHSSVIVEGKVISQTSYWDNTKSFIYTVNEIEVYKSFKGNYTADKLYVLTVGGTVGGTKLTTSELLKLQINDLGIFLCNSSSVQLSGAPASRSYYETFGSPLGYVHYSFKEKLAKDPFNKYELTSKKIYQLFSPASKTSYKEIKAFNLESLTSIPEPLSSPIINSISPSIVTAGTNTIITITGSGFGTGPGGSAYKVSFSNADNGGSTIDVTPHPSQYISWTDNQIIVEVPSTNYSGTGSAGTGKIMVSSNSGSTLSSTNLTISYSRANSIQNENVCHTNFYANDANGSFVWMFNDIFYSNTEARGAFKRAMNTWRCNTQVNWEISRSITPVSYTSKDGMNVITFGPLPNGILGTCYQWYNADACGPNDVQVSETDIVFSYFESWYFGKGSPMYYQKDFESVALHELGHAHQLPHVIDNADVMHYSISDGASRRILNSANIECGTLVLSESLNSSCSSNMAKLSGVCLLEEEYDAGISSATSFSNSLCQGRYPIHIKLKNFGRSNLTSAKVQWSVNGILQPVYNWTGLLLKNEESSFLLGYYNFPVEDHKLKIWVSSPNTVPDEQNLNDTLSFDFTPTNCASNEAGIVTIAPVSDSRCSGTYDLKVRFKNRGLATVTSVSIYSTINGIKYGPYLWTGNIAPGDTSMLITTGAFYFGRGTSTIKVYTDLPNGSTDGYIYNDTLTSFYHSDKLQGIYTIGGAAPDFSTITDAVNALHNSGLCGPVEFRIRNGEYNEQILFTKSIAGTSSVNTITFTSESGDSSKVILNPSSVPVIQIDSADYITISKLTLKSSYYNPSVLLTQNADYTQFLNNVFDDVLLTSYTYNKSYNNNYLTIKNNLFKSVNSNSLKGIQLGSEYTASINFDKGVVIDHNIFTNSRISINYADSTIVTNNIFNIPTNSEALLSIRSSKNFIQLMNNDLRNSKGRIAVEYCTNSSNKRSLIANNLCSSLLFSRSTNVFIVYNTIKGGLYIGDQVKDVKIFNNCVAELNGGTAVVMTEMQNVISDYNNFYTTGSILGTYNGPPGYDLKAWQSNTLQDAHSISVNPEFSSEMDYTIHPTSSNIYLNNAGIFIPDVLDDFNHNVRSSNDPDIGAYEFNLYDNDAQIAVFEKADRVCLGLNDVRIKIKNNSAGALKNVTINWKVNGILQPSYNWSGDLSTGDTSSFVAIGSPTLSSGINSIVAWTSNPNGFQDERIINDTLKLNALAQGLSGTYTIGGSSPDYTTITSALDALTTQGVCGPVILNIRPGVYKEKLTISTIPGSSIYNTITLKSETNDSSSVTIAYAQNNYIINITNADHLRFEYLRIVYDETNFGFGYPFTILNSDNVVIRNCYIAAQEYNDAITWKGTINDRIVLENNIIANAEYLFNCTGGTEVTIRGNKFTGAKINSILLRGSDMPIIASNLFECENGKESIYMEYIKRAITITGNAIKGGEKGIHIDQCQSNEFHKSFIANNFITAKTGIYLRLSTHIRVLHNSVSSNSNSGYAIGWNEIQEKTITLKNNIFSNSKGGLAFSSDTSSISNIESDYNNFYTTGKSLLQMGQNLGNINYGTDYYQSIYYWQKQSGQDLHSFEVAPLFVSDNNLHLINNYTLVNAGIVLNEVKTDIDGEVRDSKPDIGADEFSVVRSVNDAGVLLIERPLKICEGQQDVLVQLINHGSNPLTSAVIHWTVNGVPQPDYNWTGNLATNSSSPSITIGSYNFHSSAITGIKSWTTNPNGVSDIVSQNDTSTVKEIYAEHSGNYTIGGSFPDYATFNDAYNAIRRYGICGAVVFNVRSGIYDELLVLGEIKNASTINTITFQSEEGDSSKVTLLNSTMDNDYGLVLYGGDYYIFKDLTFKGSNGIVNLYKGACYNQFINNHFLVGKGASYSNWQKNSVVLSQFDNDSYTVFKSNKFENGYWGMYFSTNYTTPEKGIQIIDNEFLNQRNAGISLEWSFAPLISGNEFSSPIADTSSYVAIQMINFTDTLIIEKNKICGKFYTGIDLHQGNVKPNPENRRPLIVNNTISIDAANGIGINISFINNCDIYHNSVFMKKGGVAFYNVASDYYNILNNIFIGGRGTFYAPIFFRLFEVTKQFDYNIIHSYGSNLIQFDNADYTSLSQWQNAFGNNLNSIVVNPVFYSNCDLRTFDFNANNKGTPLPIITTDIDDEPRSLTQPDIGADEFQIAPSDAGAIASVYPNASACPGKKDISVKIKNYGVQNIFTTKIYYSINDGSISSYTWSGVLNPGTVSSSIVIGNFTFLPNTTYTLKLWTSEPNNNTDYNTSNDTLVLGFTTPELLSLEDEGLCPGILSTLDAGAGFTKYLWSTGELTPNIKIKNEGRYKVTVESVNGCTQTDSVDIKNKFVVNLGSDTSICSNVQLLLNAKNPGYSYSWSTGENTQTVLVSSAGTYAVAVDDGMGCIIKDSIKILTYPSYDKPVIVPNSSIYYCFNEPYKELEVSNYDSGLSYYWHLNGSHTPFTGKTFKPKGPGTIQVVSVNSHSCRDTSAATSVIQYPAPEKPVIAVNGNSVQVMNAIGTTTLQWYCNNISIPDGNKLKQEILNSGWYKVKSTDLNGCSLFSDSINVTVTGIVSEKENLFNVYPNPSEGIFFLEIKNQSSSFCVIKIVNSLGVLVREEKLELNNSSTIRKINMEEYGKGFYYLIVNTPQNHFIEKLAIE